jgi:hypothetical protein
MWRRRLLRAPPWKPLAVWWASLIVLTISWAPLNEALLLRSPRELSLSVDSVRITLWQQAISSIAQSPWIGYGWRQTVVAQKFGAPFAPGEVATDYWHNIVLDLLCWVGLPMGLLVMGLVVVWTTRTVVRISTSTQVWLLAFAMPVLVHSMLEFPFAYAFFLFPVAAMLGAVYAIQAPASYETASGLRRGIGVITAAVFACVGAVVFSEYMRAEEDLRVMRFEMRNVGRTPADYARPELRLLTQMGAVLTLGRTEPFRGMTTAELQRWKRANQALSWATFHLKYIVALALNGQEEEARRELNVLASIYGPATYRQTLTRLIELRRTRYPDLPASFPN